MSVTVNGTVFELSADGSIYGKYKDGDAPNGGAPDAPTGFTAIYNSDTSLTLGWTDNSDNETGFEIDSSLTGTGSWTNVTTTPANTVGHIDSGLTVDTQYFYRIRAVNGSGNSSYATANGTTTAGGSLTLLASQDFEDSNDIADMVAKSGLPMSSDFITTNLPSEGTQCLRFNLKNGVTDPHTGQAGDASPDYNWEPGVTREDTMTWEFDVRFDDATWDGTGFGGFTGASSVDLKIFYLTGPSPNDTENSFYFTSQGGDTGAFAMADNGGSNIVDWEDRTYGWRNLTTGNNMRTLRFAIGSAFGAGTGWHKLTFEIDYDNGGAGYSKARWLVDDSPLLTTNLENPDNGWFNLPPEQLVDNFRLGFTANAQTGLSVDRTESACGQQFDNFKVYGGIV